MAGVAFYVLVWVFAVEHPSGETSERVWFFKNKIATEAECQVDADKAEAGIPMENLTEDGGRGIYSRFVCVPVPE